MKLSLALDLYDRHLPFFLGTVRPPPGVELEVKEVGMAPPRRHGINRHARMLHAGEFDIAEVSLASYIMAKSRGAPFTAIPVFPRRLFSQNHIFVHKDSGIRTPQDLTGRRILIWAFQVTMSVLAKGDLRRTYGVDWRNITWITQHAEELPWTAPAGVRVERSTSGKDAYQLLMDGSVDAYIYPHPPRQLLEAPEIRRLFSEPTKEATLYYKRNGYYPIMHLLVFRENLIRQVPNLGLEMLRMWEEAKHIAADYYTDPGFSELAFARNEYENQVQTLGPNIWPSGFGANRANLERFVEDCADQVLIPTPFDVRSLFHGSCLDT